ncbi:MAG: alpha/beta hydrolase family protein [Phototrophicaceae bacterium]|jgi:alpha/beta superfamily hydrolase
MHSLADTDAIYFYATRPDGTRLILTGVYYQADTKDPAPFALLLHGLPGSEKNHDLAHALRASGWHVLVLNFAGSWGSRGNYALLMQQDDVEETIDYILGERSPRPIDPQKIAVVGYSLGSRAAIMQAAQDERIGALVVISGVADYSLVHVEEENFYAVLPFVNGIKAKKLAEDFNSLGVGIQPRDAIKKVTPRPVLVVQGTEDEVMDPQNATMFIGENIKRIMIENANHEFASYRPELVAHVHDWLQAWVKTR